MSWLLFTARQLPWPRIGGRQQDLANFSELINIFGKFDGSVYHPLDRMRRNEALGEELCRCHPM
jgi:hypothetical protein